MIRLLRVVAALPALLISVPGFAESDPEGAPQEKTIATPIELVRTLQAMQDQIATGSTDAHIAQRALLTHIDNQLMQQDQEVWRESKNIRAAVVFVLSGGRPSILRKLSSLDTLEKKDEVLVKGALAYVEGREAEARRILNDIDVHLLPPILAGQIALVQSALIVRDDPARSVALLDFVRLQLPGTLIEEAALRREIFVVSQMKDASKFEALSRQYLHRFRHSVYGGNFRQRFAAALTRLEFAKDEEKFARLISMLSELEADGQRELYLLIARAAIDQGQTKAAVLAAEKALEMSAADKIGSARARLYKAAASIVTVKGFESSFEELQKVDRASLPPNDAILLDTALSTANQIRKGFDKPKPEAVNSKPALPPVDGPEAKYSLPSISKAHDAIGRVDALFRKETR